MLLSALAAGSASLLGCGGDSSGKVLDLWTWALRPRFDDLIGAAIADFESQHAGLRVRWTDVAAEATQRKVFAAGAAGTMPDVINLPDQHFAKFAKLGAFRPLGDVSPGDPAERYVPGALDACRVDGQLLGYPWYLSTTVRVMNRRLLAEGGLTPDTLGRDWQTLLDQARPFKEATGKHLFSIQLGDRSDLPAMMLSDGIDLVTPHPDGGMRATLTTPRVIDTITTWADAFSDGTLPRSAATGGYEGLVLGMTGGSVAMINANALNRIATEAPRVYEDIVVGGGVVGSLGVPGMAVTHVSVSALSRHPHEAAALAWHLTGPKWQTELALDAGRSPSTLASLDDSRFAATTDDPQAIATEMGVEQVRDAQAFAPPTGTWPDLRRVFNEAMKRVLLEGEPVADAMAATEAEWNRILRADAAGEPYA